MPFDPHNESDLAARTSAIGVTDAAFQGQLAVGVRNKPRSGRTTWVVLDIATGRCVAHVVRELASTDLPEEELGVKVAMAATPDTWSHVGDDADFLEAVQAQKYFVTGEAPFWIRHLRSMLEVLAAFR